jgi:hypothetical protein
VPIGITKKKVVCWVRRSTCFSNRPPNGANDLIAFSISSWVGSIDLIGAAEVTDAHTEAITIATSEEKR